MLTPMRVWALVWCSLLPWGANACDGCGGGNATQGIGSLPQNGGSFIGLYSTMQQLRLTEPPLFKSELEKVTHFTSYNISLLAAWQIHKKWSIVVSLPYKITSATTSVSTKHYNGFGDAFVYAMHQPINQSGQRLNLRAGCKSPTGLYKADAKEGLPASFQLGTGSWDAVLGINWNRQWQWWQFNADAQYLMTTPNRNSYKFGNQATAQALARYQVLRSSLGGTLMVGARAQYGWSDYADYHKKYLLKNSGGWVASTMVGLSLGYRSFFLQSMFHIPVVQQLNSSNWNQKPAIELSLICQLKK